MIDTLKVLVPCAHPLPIRSSLLTRTDGDGVVLRTTNLPVGARGIGSYLRIRSRAYVHPATGTVRDGLEIEGSFVKFLNGHNLFGRDNLRLLVSATFAALQEGLGERLTPTHDDLYDIEAGHYRVLRADLTEMYRLPEGVTGQMWIDHAEMGIRHRRKRPQRTGNSLYLNKESSRWSFKVYPKEGEFAHSPPPTFLPCQAELGAYASGTLRVEVFLREKELKKRSLHLARQWGQETGEGFFQNYLGRVQVLGQVRPTDDLELRLSPAELRYYQTWRSGMNLHAAYRSPATRIKYQKRFAELGVDVLAPPPTTVNRVDLRAVFEQEPLGVPAFALHEPMLLLGAKTFDDLAEPPAPLSATRIYVRTGGVRPVMADEVAAA